MDTVQSKDGTPIAYERSGSGPSLVLVHGTTADHTRWRPILPALAERFTVYAVDRRGRGGSGDATTYAVDREYEDIATVVDSIGGQVDLLAHSYGALVSMEAALQTSNIRKLILYEPPFSTGEPMYPPGARQNLQRLYDEGDMEKLLMAFMTEVVRMPPLDVEALRNDASWPTRLALAPTIPRETSNEDYAFEPERFRSLTTPTLLLMGSESPRFLQKPCEALAEVLPNARLVVLEGQGHAAMNTAPELFLREVLGFLKEAA
jgi:pimeloyl-ACP methyl ester carboxylesterase